ncbi:flavin reductase family protein [Methylicorpusculum sp.]|uniref:flavin reductase family protein n=1 Tax=Methylicorpusculum sp. TaxID=2713644 RepID=UPI0027237A65|nr:flavin reductase family protein [Methylicorpusculum sp.]MDO8843499.1 flavin reductase family protein [Methylicorpusculum sp.]
MTTKLADLFKLISHGVYVIGVCDGNNINAFTAAWVMQVSFDPPMLAFSINPQHTSYQLLRASGVCSVNVLSDQQMALAERFGSSGKDKMSGIDWQTAVTGAPILPETLAFFDCEVSSYADAGDHQVVVCRVVDAQDKNPGRPMLYGQTGEMDQSERLYSGSSEESSS